MMRQRYTMTAIALHWLHAALIVALLWIGWTMVVLPKGPDRGAAYGLHKSLGLLALLVVALRAAWRWRNPAPAAILGGWEARLATMTHHALYLCLVGVPLAGFLMVCFTPYPLKFFGFELPKPGWPDEGLNGVFKLLHLFFAWTMVALIGLHIAGAIKHAIRRDGVLQRMLSGR